MIKVRDSAIRVSLTLVMSNPIVFLQVGNVAYQLELSTALFQIRGVFHVFSSLRKYVADPFHILEAEPLRVTPRPTYEEQPVTILVRDTQYLHPRSFYTIPVLWCD